MDITEAPGQVVRMHPMESQFFVVGHVSAEDAIAAVTQWWSEDRDSEPPELGPCDHSFGCWVENEEYEHGSAEWPYAWFHSTAYPDETPVTVVWERSDWHISEQSKAMGAEALMRARRLWPRAERYELSSPCGGWRYRESCSVRVWLRSCAFSFYPWRQRCQIERWAPRLGLSVSDALERAGFRRAA